MNTVINHFTNQNNLAGFVFASEQLTIQEMVLKFYEQVSNKGEKTCSFVKNFKKQLKHIKQNMYEHLFSNCETIILQLRKITVKIVEAIMECERLFKTKKETIKTSKNKMLEDLQQLRLDVSMIRLYLEV
ncbi:hypothetical protein A8C32_08030 [Flavivirga aquatica]|uniref:Uncharacterized protein n=1 Tax=Flavivirga aquatica TaxID=1849968 RepID=A0A1E5SJ24_9FLAO|nr:hypothetical protein [Flavivirga aquatica]OEJ99113.1 hypothetical protein A8C32_08030 [Flavivirga aquatica]